MTEDKLRRDEKTTAMKVQKWSNKYWAEWDNMRLGCTLKTFLMQIKSILNPRRR